MAEFSDLYLKTCSTIEIDTDLITFILTTGEKYQLFHRQDCCEQVRVEEIIGDLDDIVGTPILMAEEVTNHDNPPSEYAERWLWTFYKLATIKGYVTIRWLGTSNGYYSEAVDFEQVEVD